MTKQQIAFMLSFHTSAKLSHDSLSSSVALQTQIPLHH